MSIFDKIADIAGKVFPPIGLAKNIIKAISGSTGKSEDELAGLEPAIAELIVQRDIARDTQRNKTLQTELESRAAIITAEMQQGDAITRRARPAVVYTGLAMFCVEFGIRAYLILNHQPMPVETIIPVPMITGWTAVTSIWAVGRSVEKVKGQTNGNSILSKITKGIVG